jgi:ammonium transporter, Amt family
LWFGWFEFNAGSALSANARAAMAGFVTTIAASAGALSWVLVVYAKIKKLSGAIAGLVGITPAAGFVSPWAAIIIGAVTGITCCFAIELKDSLGYDDALDAFGLHGVGGFVGSILTGLLVDKNLVMSLDGTEIAGGPLNGTWQVVGTNLTGAIAISAYAFLGTTAILYLINLVPGLNFRPSKQDELLGGDIGEMGEVAYELISPNQLKDESKAESNIFV